MKKLIAILLVILPGLIALNSCVPEDEMIPKEVSLSNVKSNHDALLSSALKFEAVHQIPIIPGGEMPLPEFISRSGNRFRFKAPIMTIFGNVTPSEAAGFLSGGILIGEMEAFWKVPNSDPALIMMGTGPAKGDFEIERDGETIWKGTIRGIRLNLGSIEKPLFQWKGHITAIGVGKYEGLKLTAREWTEPDPMPAMTYFWSGVITPGTLHCLH